MRHLNPIHLLLLLALMGLSLGLSACRSAAPPITYYTLDPLSLSDKVPRSAVDPTALRVGVGPVSLPTYLQRAQIITRSGNHTLAVNDFHRWAGPLDEEILRVLLVSVGKALPGAEVLPYPWGRSHAPTHQVRLTVQRFDGQIGGQVHLRGIWHLTCQTESDKSVSRSFDITEKISASGIAGLVDAQNHALGTLTGQIVAALCAAP